MKVLFSILLLFFSTVGFAMEKAPTPIEQLPREIVQYIIIPIIIRSNRLIDAVKNLRNLTITNKHFYQIINNEETTQIILNALVKRFPNQTEGNLTYAAIALNTRGAQKWLAQNNPTWFADITNPANLEKLKDRFRIIPRTLTNTFLLNPRLAHFFARYQDEHSNTLLDEQITANNVMTVELLLKAGANPNIQTVGRLTPLLNAAQMPNTDIRILKSLLDAGADINTQDSYGSTPLMNAARAAHVKAVKLLLDYGANPFLIDSSGKTAKELVLSLLSTYGATYEGKFAAFQEIVHLLSTAEAEYKARQSKKRKAIE